MIRQQKMITEKTTVQVLSIQAIKFHFRGLLNIYGKLVKLNNATPVKIQMGPVPVINQRKS